MSVFLKMLAFSEVVLIKYFIPSFLVETISKEKYVFLPSNLSFKECCFPSDWIREKSCSVVYDSFSVREGGVISKRVYFPFNNVFRIRSFPRIYATTKIMRKMTIYGTEEYAVLTIGLLGRDLSRA